jgi:hypothetical protein
MVDLNNLVKGQLDELMKNPQSAAGMVGGAAPMLIGVIMKMKKGKDPPKVTDVAGQIKQLAGLRDEGNISKEEYENAKTLLLESFKMFRRQKQLSHFYRQSKAKSS